MSDSEEDSQGALIRWLEPQPPDVRHYVAGLLNWDNCERVLEWIATREDTDIATAKAIFWGCDPVGLLSEGSPSPSNSYRRLAHLVCERAMAHRYLNTGLADDLANLEAQSARLRSALARTKTRNKFIPPIEFLESQKGRAPIVAESMRAAKNPELRKLLWNLGMDVSEPSSAGSSATPARRDLVKGILWLSLAGVLGLVAALAKCSDRRPRQPSKQEAR